jgi:hypothetical protein
MTLTECKPGTRVRHKSGMTGTTHPWPLKDKDGKPYPPDHALAEKDTEVVIYWDAGKVNGQDTPQGWGIADPASLTPL